MSDKMLTIDGVPICNAEFIGERLKELAQRVGPGYLTDCTTSIGCSDMSLDLKVRFSNPMEPKIVTYVPLGGYAVKKPEYTLLPPKPVCRVFF